MYPQALHVGVLALDGDGLLSYAPLIKKRERTVWLAPSSLISKLLFRLCLATMLQHAGPELHSTALCMHLAWLVLTQN